MIEVDVNGAGGIERALKKLKKRFRDMGILRELRRRREYTKPSQHHREEILAARHKESQRSDQE